jgi:hypothetical protein
VAPGHSGRAGALLMPPADNLTILRPVDHRRMMAKEYEISPNGLVAKREFTEPKHFSVTRREVDGIEALHAALVEIEREPRVCVIRGEPRPDIDLTHTRRVKKGEAATFDDVPRQWIMVDADKVPLPAGTSVIDDPADVARYMVELFAGFAPELEGVTAVVQFTASAGIGEMAEAEAAAGMPPRWAGVSKPGSGTGAHLWFWLTGPQGEAELVRWANAINAKVGNKAIDPATLRTVQPHYTAGPVFGAGLRDPLAGRRTVLVRGSADAATLEIPAEPERPAHRSGGSGSTSASGIGFPALLSRIGDPVHGFHGPINAAIASYVATNWPNPDVDALVEMLRDRILSADPGGRSPAEIERYANPGNLRARIEWTMDREREKHQAEQAEAERPVEPTYPDRGVTLAEAARITGEAIAGFAARIANGETPQLLIGVTVGGGKTFSAIDALPDLLAAGEAAGLGPVLFTHPRHKLGDQIAADVTAQHPDIKVAVYRGMDAADPERPGEKMCRDPELSGAAIAAGQGATAGCTACVFGPTCSYLAQDHLNKAADVYVAPHQVQFYTPFSGWPRTKADGKSIPVQPTARIVDEDISGAGIGGMDERPVQLALSALQSDATPNLTGADRERLLYLRRRVFEALANHPPGPLFREAVEWMGKAPDEFTSITAANELALLEWDTKPKVKIGKSATRAEAMAAFGDAAAQGFTRLRPRLAESIADFLASGDARSVNLTMVPEADLGHGVGTGPAIQFTWRKDFHDAWRSSLLFLDATGRPEILRHWAPDLEAVEIEVQAPHQHVTQVADREFSRAMMTMPGNSAKLADLVMVELATAKGEVLVISQMAAERLLRAEVERRGGVRDPLPEGISEDAPAVYRFPSGAVLHLAHFGDITGSNAWQDVETLIEVGRPATNRTDGERLAEVIAGRAIATVADGEMSHWPTVPGGIRMADGTGRPVQQPRHPDPLVEAVRWSVTDGSVLQGVGRPRGVRRAADNPVRVLLLCPLALPLTVAEVKTWAEVLPDRLTVAAAEAALMERAMPFGAADMAAVRHDLWPTEKTAKRSREETAARIQGRAGSKGPNPLIVEIYKAFGAFSRLAPAHYRKAGARRWSAALVPATGRAALETLIGPVEAFELLGPLPAAPEARRPAPAPETTAGIRPADPAPLPIDGPAIYTTLHPPLPGEGAPALRPVRAASAGPIIVATGPPPPAVAWPEPGSFEPEDAVVEPPPLPAEAPAPWEAELQRRLARYPRPKIWDDEGDDAKQLFWHLRQDSIRATWAVDWREAWQAGQRLPVAEEGP